MKKDWAMGSVLGERLQKDEEAISKEKMFIFKIICALSPDNISKVKFHLSLSYSL